MELQTFTWNHRWRKPDWSKRPPEECGILTLFCRHNRNPCCDFDAVRKIDNLVCRLERSGVLHQIHALFRLKQFMGFLSLAVYCMGGAKILPALLVVTANMEGSHTVQAVDCGSTCRVVLHHGSRPCPEVHQHGLASKVFCWFASQDNSDPDHVLQMANGAVSESASLKRTHKLPENTSQVTNVFSSPFLWRADTAQDLLFAVSPNEQHPPPESSHLSALRVTVLVI